MGRKPDLYTIVERMNRGEEFVLDRKEYIAITGIDLPQDKNYTEKRSAIAKKAKEYGYYVEVISEKIKLYKIK